MLLHLSDFYSADDACDDDGAYAVNIKNVLTMALMVHTKPNNRLFPQFTIPTAQYICGIFCILCVCTLSKFPLFVCVLWNLTHCMVPQESMSKWPVVCIKFFWVHVLPNSTLDGVINMAEANLL